jgi:hypothetical protein
VAQSRDQVTGDLASLGYPANLNNGQEPDLNDMFESIVEDSFANFNANYDDDSLRELLANEGFDWFSKD